MIIRPDLMLSQRVGVCTVWGTGLVAVPHRCVYRSAGMLLMLAILWCVAVQLYKTRSGTLARFCWGGRVTLRLQP